MCMYLRNHHTRKVMNVTDTTKRFLVFLVSLYNPFLSPFYTPFPQFTSNSKHFLEFSVNGIIWYILSGEWGLWPFSLTMIILRLIHRVACIDIYLCVLLSIIPLYDYSTTFFFFIQSAVSGYLGFQFLAIANKAAVKIRVQVITECTMVYTFTY